MKERSPPPSPDSRRPLRPGSARRARRWGRRAGGVGLLLAAIVASCLVRWKEAPKLKAALARGGVETPAKLPSMAVPLAPPPTAGARVAALPPAAGDPRILQNASHDELVSAARDMLANGSPLEDVVALLEYLAASKPEFAIDLARDIGRSDGERHVLLYTVLGDWAHDDAPSAVRWAFQHADAYNVPGNASLLYIVLEQVATDNPRALLAVAEGALQPGPGSTPATAGDVPRLTIEALLKTGNTDLARQAVEQWAHGPEHTRLDDNVYEIVTLSLAQTSFTNAALWLESLPSSPARNEALGPVAAVWSQQDPRAAMEWAQGLDPADGGDDVRVATFARWLKSDAPAAKQWLQSHPKPDTGRLLALLH